MTPTYIARRLLPPLALACLALAVLPSRRAAAQSPPPPTLSFTQIYPRQTLFDYATDACPVKNIPDGPVRAFKRADGKFVLVNNTFNNWQMVGSTPFDLTPQCASVLPYDGARGQSGIDGTYTEDGQTIYGVTGQDLSVLNFANGCQDKYDGNCWQNDIEGIVSTDGGNNYSYTSSYNGNVAALTHTLSNSQPGSEGFFGSSNIVKRGGYYYMIAFAEDAYATGAAKYHNCLLRTSNLADPTSWRGYDGSGFTAPLQPNGSGPGPIQCVDVGIGSLVNSVNSLSFITSKGVYIAVTEARLQLAGDKAPVSGAYYSTSPNLINWSPTKRLMAMPLIQGVDSTTEADFYPTLIDPFSRSRNFETIDSNTPVLVYTLMHLGYNSSGTLNRDLMAVPLMMR